MHSKVKNLDRPAGRLQAPVMDPKTKSYLIWYILFIGTLLPVNWYVCLRGWQALPEKKFWRRAYTGLFLFLALSYFTGRAVESVSVCTASDFLFWIGSCWFGFMLYFFIAALCAAAAAVLAIQGAGFFNARDVAITRLEVDVPNETGGMKELSIALASDIRLGTIISKDRLERMVDARFPVILMDHNPARTRETVGRPVDLSLSGHTHDGQMWPITLITNAICEISRGYRKIGATHFYVSPGFGALGPPVRVGTTPEIAHIVLHFR